MPLNFDLQVFAFGLVAEDVGQTLAILQLHAGPEFQGLDFRQVENVPKAHGGPQGQQGEQAKTCRLICLEGASTGVGKGSSAIVCLVAWENSNGTIALVGLVCRSRRIRWSPAFRRKTRTEFRRPWVHGARAGLQHSGQSDLHPKPEGTGRPPRVRFIRNATADVKTNPLVNLGWLRKLRGLQVPVLWVMPHALRVGAMTDLAVFSPQIFRCQGCAASADGKHGNGSSSFDRLH